MPTQFALALLPACLLPEDIHSTTSEINFLSRFLERMKKNMGIITPLMGFTIAIKARRSGGAFWHNPCILSFMKSHSSPTKT